MALITCQECGREISDRATACPHCGCPISKIEEHAESENEVISEQQDLSGMLSTLTQKAGTELNRLHSIRTIGPVQINEMNRTFRVNGGVPMRKKKSGLGMGLFKGALAISTLGMSVAAEKAIKGSNKTAWFDFSDLLSYELLEDDSLVTSGGVGQALIGGAIGTLANPIVGGLGAIAGGLTGKRTQKKQIESLYIKATVNSLSAPCILIPLIQKPTKTSSKEYQTAFTTAQQILSTFDVITHNK